MTRFLPLVVFAALVFVMVLALLTPSTSRHPSGLGKAMPHVAWPLLDAPEETLSTADMAGDLAIVNFFASWCAPCRAEQQMLARLAEQGGVRIYGVSYKDKPEDTKKFLQETPQLYTAVGMDPRGDGAMAWGVTGVPETFITDKSGVIRYRLQGPLTEREIESRILPLLSELKKP